MNQTIILDEDNPEVIKTILIEGLREYNQHFFGQYEKKDFAIYIQDEKATIIAGICGFIIEKHQTMRLEFVWVHKEHRKKGIGSKMLFYIEKYATLKQCKFLQVSTLEFQAVGFYQKMGYTQIGIIPQWFCAKDEVFFLKQLP
jgi:ribosomal protein S18 acetylase RimI-like enzyme